MTNQDAYTPSTRERVIASLRACLVKPTKAGVISIACASLLSVSGVANSREVHKAHTHGVANLTLAFESGALEVQLEAPAMSLLGFEHAPETKAHVATINKTKALLNEARTIFFIDGANCTAEQIDVNVIGPAGKAISDKPDHEEGHHEEDHHEEDHHEEGHDEDHEEHGNHHKSTESHSEVSAMYVFDCGDAEEIKSVNVALFEHFTGLEKINVSWITSEQQGQVVLQANSSTIELK